MSLPSPQQKRSVARRAACVDAARRIMLVDGVHALTMHGASVAAGGSKGAIYRYFIDRADLVEAVVAAERERVEALFERYVDGSESRTESQVVVEAVRAMVDLRTSRTGCVPITMNSLGQSRHRDHVSRYAWTVAGRVRLATGADVENNRADRYAHIIAAVDALLVRSRRSAPRRERAELMKTCLGVAAAALGAAAAPRA